MPSARTQFSPTATVVSEPAKCTLGIKANQTLTAGTAGTTLGDSVNRPQWWFHQQRHTNHLTLGAWVKHAALQSITSSAVEPDRLVELAAVFKTRLTSPTARINLATTQFDLAGNEYLLNKLISDA